MRATEFCYWLQGYLLLAECGTLNRKQIGMVKARLDLVFKYANLAHAKPSVASNFCYLLDGMISTGGCEVALIKSELNKCFLHEIDPSYGDNVQDVLNEIHSGNTKPLTDEDDNPVVMRC